MSEPSLGKHERLKGASTHLRAAERELRDSLRAALNDDAPASFLLKIAVALDGVAYIVPWAVSLGETGGQE